MLWKIGCGLVLVGGLVTAGSCFFFSSAVERSEGGRQVEVLALVPGEAVELGAVLVDPTGLVRLDFTADIELNREGLESAERRSKILKLSAPIRYRVRDPMETVVHLGAGDLTASQIVPAAESPHWNSFAGRSTLSHQSQLFEPPESGSLVITAELPAADRDGNRVLSAELAVFDRSKGGATTFAMSGIASLLLGPIVLGVGGLLFLIGLIVALSKRSWSAAATQ